MAKNLICAIRIGEYLPVKLDIAGLQTIPPATAMDVIDAQYPLVGDGTVITLFPIFFEYGSFQSQQSDMSGRIALGDPFPPMLAIVCLPVRASRFLVGALIRHAFRDDLLAMPFIVPFLIRPMSFSIFEHSAGWTYKVNTTLLQNAVKLLFTHNRNKKAALCRLHSLTKERLDYPMLSAQAFGQLLRRHPAGFIVIKSELYRGKRLQHLLLRRRHLATEKRRRLDVVLGEPHYRPR